MARKAQKKAVRKSSPRKKAADTSSVSDSEKNFSFNLKNRNASEIIRELASNPTVRYVAGGIAAAVLTRLSQSLSEKYPELSRFLRENIDSFEDRLGQYRDDSSSGSEARA